MIQGLYHQLSAKSQLLAARNATLADPSCGPQALHSAKLNAEILEREIEALKAAIAEDEELVRDLQGLLIRVQASKHSSRHRSLVVTELETAQSRLLRELGDKIQS